MKVKLFHTTNRLSAENMLKVGMGMNLDDYQNLAIQVALFTKTPIEKLQKVIKEVQNDSEANGGVSFWQKEESAKRIANYATFGGEWKGNIVSRMLKIAARYNKLKYVTYKELFLELTGSNSEAVIVIANIPYELIINQEKIGSTSELYTYKKVSPEFIEKIKAFKN